MINPIRNKLVLPAGPIVKHAHVFCLKEGDAYVTYDVRSHASEAYVARAMLAYVLNGSVEFYSVASAHETHKLVHELYRCPTKRIVVARLHKDPSIELHHLHLPKDLLRFAYYERGGSFSEPAQPKAYFDVRFDHINSVQVRVFEDHVLAEVHTIRSAFFGKYEKVFLKYYRERNEVTVNEEIEEIDLLE